jgi:hypothetical protein
MSPNGGAPAEPTKCKLPPRHELRATSSEERKQNARFLERHALMSANLDERADKTKSSNRAINYGMMNTPPTQAPASKAAPRQLIGTGLIM